MYVKVATGTELKVDGYMRTSVILESIRLCMNFRVIDMDPDVVLGLPFLQQFDPMINWKRKTLRFNFRGRSVMLQSNSSYLTTLEKSIPALYVGTDLLSGQTDDYQTPKHWSTSDAYSTKTLSTDCDSNEKVECIEGKMQLIGNREKHDEELFLLRCVPQLYTIQNKEERPREIIQLLDEFKDIFPTKLPDGLPPNRDISH